MIRVNSVPTIELVIFDCDRVLVDRERITNTVFAQMLDELRISMTLEQMFDRFVGNSMSRCLEPIEELLEKSVPEVFVEEYRHRTTIARQKDLKPVDGIREAIDVRDFGGLGRRVQITLRLS